jgi:DNA-binding transcriptional ArsR family regulator
MESEHSRGLAAAARGTTRDVRLAYLRRVAIVFAAEIRIKIVSELYQREMSAKEFFDEFGGGSITRVDRHFKRLAEHGWLRYVRTEGPDSQRRGSREHFYRAPEPAILDNETWALLPYSVRVATSWRTFMTLAERVREALQAGTLDARDDSHLSYVTMNLDELGWETIIGAVDSFFESIFEEQADARLRMSHSGEKPIVATVALTVFESPARFPIAPVERTTPVLVLAPKDPLIPFHQRLSKIFGDKLSLNIVAEANVRQVSTPLLSEEIGADDVQGVRRRVKGLERSGWLLQVDEKTGGRRRSAKERFYKATAPAILDNESWAGIPKTVKPTFSWNVFRLLADLVKEAIVAGTFEARLDNHLSWSVLRLDQRGWENVAQALDQLLAFVLNKRDRAEDRLARSGETPITTTVGLGAFESPRSAKREP